MTIVRILALLSIAAAALPALGAPGDPLISDPFINSYNGWVDPNPTNPNQSPTLAPATVEKPNWGIHLRTGALQESGGGRWGDSTSSTDGRYTPYIMINDNFTTPDVYNFTTTLTTNDDDGFGVVFGWQDTGNYFRVGLRNQSSNLGFGRGVSVQKVVNNTITQIAAPSTTFVPKITDNDAANYFPMNVKVEVNGTAWSVYVDNTLIHSGTDADLKAGKIGVHSWYERNGGTANSPSALRALWGVEASQVTVTDANNANTLFSESFTSPVSWRAMTMRNSAGNTGGQGDDLGNFRLQFPKGRIGEDSNGYEWATQATPNVDFISPAVAVNEPGSSAMSNYEMKVRVANLDDDGVGVLLRVQENDSAFYRVNFARQTITATNMWERAPQGLSVQKFKDGVWSELFRDNQSNPLFVFMDDSGGAGTEVPFDLSVKAIGNQLFVQVTPVGGLPINYPVITDLNDPILAGSVGLASWGNGGADNGAYYTWYGGIPGTPLVVEIPEPGLCLMMMAACGIVAARRRRSLSR